MRAFKVISTFIRPSLRHSFSTHTINSASSIVIYTDGSCLGNKNVKSQACPTGWSVVIATLPDEEIIEEIFGPVVLNKQSQLYLGATVGSNNTAELTAVGEAMHWILNRRSLAQEFSSLIEKCPVVVYYDSEYAVKSVIGEFNGRMNRDLILRIRKLYKQVLDEGIDLEFKHVKGHSGDRLNDRADELAKMAANGVVCTTGRAALLEATQTKN